MRHAIAIALLAACSSAPPPKAATPDPAPQVLPPASGTEQSATLRSRVHPFALFVARVHRKLHDRWGGSFLPALDRRAPSDPLNDPSLAVKLAIAIDAQGALADVHVVQTSRVPAFDQAALDAFRAAAPFDAPADAVLAKDGRVRLHWTLYRDERECGTFDVEPLDGSE